MLSVVRTFGDDLPAACQTTCQDAWSCLDLFISEYGSDYDASDRVTRLIRHGLTFFGPAGLPVASAVVSRMTSSFETTGNPGYVWIIGKIVSVFGNEEDPKIRAAFKESYDRVSAKVFSSLQEKSPAAIPDGKQKLFKGKLLLLTDTMASPRGLHAHAYTYLGLCARRVLRFTRVVLHWVQGCDDGSYTHPNRPRIRLLGPYPARPYSRFHPPPVCGHTGTSKIPHLCIPNPAGH